MLAEFARAGFLNIVGGCCGTTPEHIRAIGEAVRGDRAARACRQAADALRLVGPGAVQHRRRLAVRQRRRAHQRHRLEGVRAPDPRRRVRRRARRSRASRSRTARRSSTSTWTRRCSTRRRRWSRFLNLIASEPDIARVPVMIDSLEVERDRGGPEVRAGQGRSSTRSRMKEGEEEFLRQARLVPPLRRGGGRDGLRREGPGRHARAQDRDLPARLRAARRRRSASRPRTSSSTRTSSRSPPASRSTTTTRVDFIEATRWIRENLPHAQGVGRRLERVVLLPRQRPGARGDPHRVPVPRDQRRHDDGHRQRRPARRLRRARPGAARARRGRGAQPPRRTRPSGWSSSPTTRQGRRARSRQGRLAWRAGQRRGAPVARAGATASPRYIVEDTEEARQQVRAARSR